MTGGFFETYQLKKFRELGLHHPCLQDNHSQSRQGGLRLSNMNLNAIRTSTKETYVVNDGNRDEPIQPVVCYIIERDGVWLTRVEKVPLELVS
jgi:hypothetical protein